VSEPQTEFPATLAPRRRAGREVGGGPASLLDPSSDPHSTLPGGFGGQEGGADARHGPLVGSRVPPETSLRLPV